MHQHLTDYSAGLLYAHFTTVFRLPYTLALVVSPLTSQRRSSFHNKVCPALEIKAQHTIGVLVHRVNSIGDEIDPDYRSRQRELLIELSAIHQLASLVAWIHFASSLDRRPSITFRATINSCLPDQLLTLGRY